MNDAPTDAGTRMRELLDPRRTALLIIDVQVDFGAREGLYGRVGCDLSRVDAAVDRMIALRQAARAAGVHTIFVRLETGPESDSPAAQLRRERLGMGGAARPCVTGSPGAEYYRLRPQAGDGVVVKCRYSSFTNTSLEFQLRARPGIDTLVVCGLTTECCVETAARDAFVRDYHIFLPRDACASYRTDMHDVSVDVMAQFFAIVTTTADITRGWNAHASAANAPAAS